MAEAVWKLICSLSESLAQDCTQPDTCSMLIGQAKRGRVLVSTQRDSVAACGLSRASSGCIECRLPACYSPAQPAVCVLPIRSRQADGSRRSPSVPSGSVLLCLLLQVLASWPYSPVHNSLETSVRSDRRALGERDAEPALRRWYQCADRCFSGG